MLKLASKFEPLLAEGGGAGEGRESLPIYSENKATRLDASTKFR